jgi:glycosyltransferase involved in cell wall biosynthesis
MTATAIRKRNPGTFLVYHSHNVEYALRQQKEHPVVAWITKFAERGVLAACDLNTAVSEVDRSQFKSLYGVDTLLVPNGVEMERFAAVPEREVERVRRKYGLRSPSALFMGLPDYLPNKEGISFLLEKVFPRVVSQIGEAKLALIGGELPFDAPWFHNPGKIPYEDVPGFVRACDLCVAPIFSGSGTRLKVLEYLAAGKPVVSTRKGAEGIEVAHGRDILVAESDDDFVEAIVRLFTNDASIRDMGSRAQKAVSEKYSWAAIASVLLSRMDEQLSAVRRGAFR